MIPDDAREGALITDTDCSSFLDAEEGKCSAALQCHREQQRPAKDMAHHTQAAVGAANLKLNPHIDHCEHECTTGHDVHGNGDHEDPHPSDATGQPGEAAMDMMGAHAHSELAHTHQESLQAVDDKRKLHIRVHVEHCGYRKRHECGCIQEGGAHTTEDPTLYDPVHVNFHIRHIEQHPIGRRQRGSTFLVCGKHGRNTPANAGCTEHAISHCSKAWKTNAQAHGLECWVAHPSAVHGTKRMQESQRGALDNCFQK
mmetsp:Transcript_116252/g.323796  ORF Transcript_116252/g.323796 Transcript_116252/m.323796 type:complete len:256 (-) Transcript_116252:8-775(-)